MITTKFNIPGSKVYRMKRLVKNYADPGVCVKMFDGQEIDIGLKIIFLTSSDYAIFVKGQSFCGVKRYD